MALPSMVQNSVRSGVADDQMLCALVRVVGRNHVPAARQWEWVHSTLRTERLLACRQDILQFHSVEIPLSCPPVRIAGVSSYLLLWPSQGILCR